MWFILSLASAVIYASMWLFARGSRGLPSSVVTSVSTLWGPLFMIAAASFVTFPWGEAWWYWYLIMPFGVMPMAFWLLTLAGQHADVTIIKPLSGLSSLSALLISALAFDTSFPAIKVFGVIVITAGLFLIYHNRWSAWSTRWPWIVLVCVLFLGINAAVIGEVLLYFPHPIVLSALNSSGACLFTGIAAGKRWSTVRFDPRTLRYLTCYAAAVAAQDILTFFAITMAPAAYVIAVKRSSILFAAMGGYFLFHERELSMQRLAISSVVVVAGVVILNVS